nr:putative ribonuclease H-like domain-containing protein [Tanacetum cinerariifolium]
MSDHEDETITEENEDPKVIPQITTNIVLKGNNAKSMTTDNDGNLKIHPPVTAEEHQQVQGEEKARTILLSALPDEHMGDFYHMIDARDIRDAIKARFNAKDPDSDEHLKIKPKPEDVNMKFLRGLPPSWSGIALILKTKGVLEYISFDDLYNKLKFLEINTKGYSSSSSTLSNAAFVSTAGSSQGNLSYQESGNGSYTTTHSVSPSFSSSKESSKSKCSVVDNVIYSFFANHKIDQHFVYEDLNQMNKEVFEEYDLKHQMAMLSIKVHRFEKKHRWKINFNGRENARQHRTKIIRKFGMIAGIKIESDVDTEGEVVSANDAIPAGVSIFAGNVDAAVVSPQSETEFALMGLSTEVSIPVTCPLPDIMFAVCAAARHQVTLKTSNLLSVKRIFKYLTAYPKLGLWYPQDSPFDLEAFSDSDYAGAN